MNRKVRIGISGRDEFWGKAVIVEWEHQYPERKLVVDAGTCYLIEPGWLDDLRRVAKECFSQVEVAPSDPSRRSWLGLFVPSGNNRKA